MGGKFVEAFVEGFTSAGTGLAAGSVGMFDGLMKTADGTLTSIAEFGATAAGIAVVLGIVAAVLKRTSRKVVR